MIGAVPAANSLAARVLAQRDSWCVLREAQAAVDDQPAKPELAVLLRRPAETELRHFSSADPRPIADRLADAVVKYAQDWRGFSTAELLGAAVGASDPVAFDREAWAAAVVDRSDWMGTSSAHLMAAISKHMASKEAIAKN